MTMWEIRFVHSEDTICPENEVAKWTICVKADDADGAITAAKEWCSAHTCYDRKISSVIGLMTAENVKENKW